MSVCVETRELLRTRYEKVVRLETMIAAWKEIPLGGNAIKAAEKHAEQFIERDQYGLYRGEAMFDVALCYLETFLEPEKAEPWLTRANTWFDEVKKTETALNTLSVPDKSKQVTQPPKTERYTDEWTNVKLSRPKAGNLFNRRECSWYISSKQKEVVLWLGLIAYAKNDNELAKAWWEKLYSVDPSLKVTSNTPSGSTPLRLLWNTEHNKGALYATPEQMAYFKSTRSRFMLLCADIELENVNMPAAERKFRRLLNDRDIQSNREQSAYCTFALATALMCQFKVNDSLSLLEKFMQNGIFNNTNTTPRALLQLAQCYSMTKGMLEKERRCYEYIVKKFPKTREADNALFFIAQSYYYKKDYNNAVTNFEAYLKKYPKGIHVKTTQSFLDECKAYLQKSNN